MQRRSTASIAALALLLAGCTTTAPPAGLSADDIHELRRYQADLRWQATGLDDSLRPPPPPVTVVSPSDFVAALDKCLTIAGFPVDAGLPDGTRSVEHRIAAFVCESSFEYEWEWQNWYNAAQLEYIYDYHRSFLVPCLERLGYPVTNAPTAEQFVASQGGWHPYFAVPPPNRAAMLRDATVPTECPSVPQGVHDPGWADMWLNP